MNIVERLKILADKKYGDFSASLLPNVNREKIIGIRTPVLRDFAKKMTNEEKTEFLNSLPHEYYEENMLHGIICSGIKDFNKCVYEIEKFLPFVDNWGVCDSTCPKIFKKHKGETIELVKKWIKSKDTYAVRFGIKTLMNFYLDEDFSAEYLRYPLIADTSEYYLSMMVAWFYATALAKRYSETLSLLKTGVLDEVTLKRTVRKSCESFRISDENKSRIKELLK